MSSQVMHNLDTNVLRDAQRGVRPGRDVRVRFCSCLVPTISRRDTPSTRTCRHAIFRTSLNLLTGWHQTSIGETGADIYPGMEFFISHRSRAGSCLGRNVIRLQSSHLWSTPGYVLYLARYSSLFINDLPNCVNSSPSHCSRLV